VDSSDSEWMAEGHFPKDSAARDAQQRVARRSGQQVAAFCKEEQGGDDALPEL
jgi:hypothetical protein